MAGRRSDSPPVTRRRSGGRRTMFVVLAITAVASLRGLYWVAVLSVPNHIDEIEHLGYVESIAERDGIPTVGRDVVSDDILAVAKDSPTQYWRSVPIDPSAADPRWGSTAQQYEGGQGPVYYALMAAPWRIGSAWDTTAAIYAVRIATVLCAVAAVPLTALLARRLFPDRPVVWWTAALVVAVVNGFNANLAAATNDALAVPLGAGALLLHLDGVRSRRRGAVLTAGFVFGLAMLNKATAVVLLPALVLASLPVLRQWRPDRRGVLRDAALYGASAALPLAGWAVWNLLTYGAAAPSSELEGLLGGPTIARDLSGVFEVLDQLRHALWDIQPYNDATTGYQRWFEAVLFVSAVAGVAVAFRRRDRAEGSRLLGMAVALPLGALAFVAFVFVVFGGAGSTPGRYLYPLLPLAACLIAGGLAVALGRRMAVVAVGALLAVGLFREVDLTHHYLRAAYEADLVVPGAVPVVEQSWADRFEEADAVAVDAGCAVAAIGLGIDEPPAALLVEAEQPEAATHLYDYLGFSYYVLSEPVRGPFTVPVPAGGRVAVSDTERGAAVRLVGGGGDPIVRAYCPVPDPGAARFAQLYPPYHPSWVTRSLLYRWPWWWAWGAVLATVAAAVAAVAPRFRATR